MESEEGKGAAFRFTLPEILGDGVNVMSEFNTSAGQSLAQEKMLNILLVEDDELDIMNVQRAFKRNNIINPLFIAGNGLEALEMLRNNRFPPNAGLYCSI